MVSKGAIPLSLVSCSRHLRDEVECVEPDRPVQPVSLLSDLASCVFSGDNRIPSLLTIPLVRPDLLHGKGFPSCFFCAMRIFDSALFLLFAPPTTYCHARRVSILLLFCSCVAGAAGAAAAKPLATETDSEHHLQLKIAKAGGGGRCGCG